MSSASRLGQRSHSRILERYLLDGERVIVATRHHWGKLLEPLLTTTTGLVLVAWIGIRAEGAAGEAALLLWWLWLVLAARLLWKLLEWRNEWFVATDKRLLKTYGLITHKVAMMPLRKVTDLNYSRSPAGRVLGYGQFLLESAGQDQAMREIDWLPDPDDTYRRICDTLFGSAGRDLDEDGPDPQPTPGSGEGYGGAPEPRSRGPWPGDGQEGEGELVDDEPGSDELSAEASGDEPSADEPSADEPSYEVSAEQMGGFTRVAETLSRRRLNEDDSDITAPIPRL